jgi:SNF2 family DNA or RNA helicase
MNVLMYLRKVCNHPDLFAPREVASPMHLSSIDVRDLVHGRFFLDLPDGPRLLRGELELGYLEAEREVELMRDLDFSVPFLRMT